MSARWLALSAAAFLASTAFAQRPAETETSPVAGPVTQVAAGEVERVVEAAQRLLAAFPEGAPPGILGVDRRAAMLLPVDDPNRQQWAYWPTERVGLPLELMSAEQRMLVHDLLLTVLSSKGHGKVVQIMQLEQILKVLDEGGLPRDVGHYVVVFFGEPSLERPWAWRFEGHHVSLNISVASAGLTVTPSFLGSNPAEVRTGSLAGFRVLSAEEDLARELLSSFSPEQQARAIVSDQAPSDIFTGNLGKERDDWMAWRTTLAPAGIPVGELNEVQKHWVRRILDEVVSTYRPEISEEYLEGIDVDSLNFAWMGSTERRAPYYYRLQGPDFVFEFDNVQNEGNHIHSVWRSKAGDFGDALERHYQTSRH